MKYITFSCLAILCLTLGLAIGCGSSKEEPETSQTNDNTVSTQNSTPSLKNNTPEDKTPALPEVTPPALPEVESQSVPETTIENNSDVVAPKTESEVAQPVIPDVELPASPEVTVENNSDVVAPKVESDVAQPVIPDVELPASPEATVENNSDVATPKTESEVAQPVIPDVELPASPEATVENNSEVVAPKTESEVAQPVIPDVELPASPEVTVENNSEVVAPKAESDVAQPIMPTIELPPPPSVAENGNTEDSIPVTESEAVESAVPEVKMSQSPAITSEINPDVVKPETEAETTENPVPEVVASEVPVTPLEKQGKESEALSPDLSPALPEQISQEDNNVLPLDDMNLAEIPNSEVKTDAQANHSTELAKTDLPSIDTIPVAESEVALPTEENTAPSERQEEKTQLLLSKGALQESPNDSGHVLPPPPNRIVASSQSDNPQATSIPLVTSVTQNKGTEDNPQQVSAKDTVTQIVTVQDPVTQSKDIENTTLSTTPDVASPAIVSNTTVSNESTTTGIVKAPFDPVKENGPIFVGWEKPLVVLVITGQQNGYLEPCGCAGLERMKGGLSRRYTFMRELREKGWPVVALDVGGMCNSFGKQAELKFHTTVSALRAMKYDAIALGKAELGFPAADILSEMVNSDGTPGMFVSSNVSVFERDANMPPTYKVIEAGGLKFGVTSVLCKSGQSNNQNTEILLSSTGESLRKVMPILQAKSDIRILLSHGTVEESTLIAKDFPDFQVIVTAGGNPEPPSKPVILPSGQYVITVGEKGMSAIVLGFFENGVVKYQRVTHDSRFAHSTEVRQMMQSYQDQLKQLWLSGLGIRPVPQIDPARGANVGPKKCETCHEHQYDIWKKSKHAQAFHSLETATPPRDYDPECVCCHVVGWHRHLYFPYQKGYMEPGKDDYLKNVSCESCHGPGEAHIAAESASDTANQEAQRAKMHVDLKYAKEKMCGDCHDLDNSPDFDPDKYWNQIQHKDPDDEDDD